MFSTHNTDCCFFMISYNIDKNVVAMFILHSLVYTQGFVFNYMYDQIINIFEYKSLWSIFSSDMTLLYANNLFLSQVFCWLQYGACYTGIILLQT